MRGGRSLAILVALLGGLVAYIYFVDAKKPVEPEGTEKRDKVFTVDADKIENLTVKASNGEVTSLKKANNAWELTAPAAGKADSSDVSGITTNLSTVEITSVVDEKPKDMAPYGLATPKVEIAYTAAVVVRHEYLHPHVPVQFPASTGKVATIDVHDGSGRELALHQI